MNQHHLHQAMTEQHIDLVCSLPCGRMADLFHWLPRAFPHVGLTREEDGVGIAAGAWLGGARPVLAVQSSGLGNMLNALLTLTVGYGLPLPILASWRGDPAETIPAQLPFNRPLPSILAAAGVPLTVIDSPDQQDDVARALAAAFQDRTPHVILMTPRCFAWEGDRAADVFPAGVSVGWSGTQGARPESRHRSAERDAPPWRTPCMTRFEAIQVVASGCGDDLVVSTLGLPSRELCAIGDRALSFYMLGSYTQASAVGLGLAMTRSDRRVIVLDGDGSLLGSSILPVIAAVAPPNLTVVCLDNGVFGSTGNQPRPGLHTADLRRMASAAGFARTWCVHDRVELQSALSASHGTLAFVHARLLPGVSMVPEVPLGMAEIRGRFMESVGRLQSPSVRAGTTGSEFTTKNH